MATTWTWLGDHLAVDFANTVLCDERGRVELIGTVADLCGWLAAEPATLPTAEAVSVSTPELDEFRQLRDRALRLLHAAVAGRPLPEADVAAVNQVVRDTATARVLGNRIGETRAASASASAWSRLLGTLTASVVDLLGRDDLANLAVCHAPGCGQFFHRSRPNQRWCSPGCGNRARVDRHRHRSAGTGSASR